MQMSHVVSILCTHIRSIDIHILLALAVASCALRSLCILQAIPLYLIQCMSHFNFCSYYSRPILLKTYIEFPPYNWSHSLHTSWFKFSCVCIQNCLPPYQYQYIITPQWNSPSFDVNLNTLLYTFFLCCRDNSSPIHFNILVPNDQVSFMPLLTPQLPQAFILVINQ